jgi:hypothetical protein
MVWCLVKHRDFTFIVVATDHLVDLSVDGNFNIKTDLKRIRWETVNWIQVALDEALVNMAMNIRIS